MDRVLRRHHDPSHPRRAAQSVHLQASDSDHQRTRPPRQRRGEKCSLKDFPGQLDLGFAAGAAGMALEAGELLRGYFERGVTTEYKGDVDWVTEADRASEQLIVSRISQQFPDHGIF